MIYDRLNKKLDHKFNEYRENDTIPQLTNREYRMLQVILCKVNDKESAYDEFLKEVLNSNMPIFSEQYSAIEMWNQEKRLNNLKNIMDYINNKFSVKGK